MSRRQKPQQLEPPTKSYADRVSNINRIVFVDQPVLNFATTLPSKLLGCQLTVGNYTDSEQIVELAVDTTSFIYSRKQTSK